MQMLKRMLLVSGLVGAVAGCQGSGKPTTRAMAGDSMMGASTPPATTTATSQPTPAEMEAAILSGTTALTSSKDFERAGEAYFSHDMRWVVFQGVPKGEQNYQMYIAQLVYSEGAPAGLRGIVRISPAGSRNTCGWFSNDGKTLIFGSTAGKEDPEEASPGYQRSGSRYRWAFSKGMEIYRITDWQRKIAFEARDGVVNFATFANRLTNNEFYDAECVLTPNGQNLIFCSDRPSTINPKLVTPATQPTTEPAPAAKQLWAMNIDGSHLVQLTKTPGYNGGPFVSPNGRRLIFRADRKGNDLLQVIAADFVFDPEGNITGLANEKAVTKDENVNWGPYWLPDNRRVVYATSKVSHANYEIFMRWSDGSHETRITYTAGPDVLPVISPDGRWMMWSSRRNGDTGAQIYVAKFTAPKGS